MRFPLPPPVEARAVIVGIETYPGLGPEFDSPGAVAGALAFANWLVNDKNVSQDSLEIWLKARDGRDAVSICQAQGLSSVSARDFEWPAFQRRFEEPTDQFTQGKFLIVYFCGHGTVSAGDGKQYLVLPHATKKQFHCFEAGNWIRQLQTTGWERFTCQLWIIDACRASFSATRRPREDLWTITDPKAVRRCGLAACAEGQIAGTDSISGPRFTRELLVSLRADPAPGWPSFDEALRTTADRFPLKWDPQTSQNPTFAYTENWHGRPLFDENAGKPQLRELLSQIDWPFERFRPYLKKTLLQHSRAVPDELDASLNLLCDLPKLDGIPPEYDFAERVARATQSNALREWIDASLEPQERAELARRLDNDSGDARLMLWYRSDCAVPCIEAELYVEDVGRGLRHWPRQPAKPVVNGNIEETLAAWLQEIMEHIQTFDLELTVDLYFPRDLLLKKEAYDTATLTMANEVCRLGEDYPAVLHCTDRYKATLKRKRWAPRARTILARLARNPQEPLFWAVPDSDLPGAVRLFTSDDETAPVWLGFDQMKCGEAVLDTALEEGLPAVLWMRSSTSETPIAQLRSELRILLTSSVEDLPKRLARWRENQTHHAFRTVAVLLDDPARPIPTMLDPFAQPRG